MTTIQEHTCAICQVTETDINLLADCSACGVFFHLNPRNDIEGIDCGDVWAGDCDQPVLQFFCNGMMILTGGPGTGKTTVVEGLAKRIIDGDVPENIKGKKLICMDLSAMVAGAMFQGQFEERLKNFIDAVIKLLIDRSRLWITPRSYMSWKKISSS